MSSFAATLMAARRGGHGDDLVHEADAARLARVEALAGERVASQLADTNGIGKLRDDDAGHQAPARFRDGEDRVVGGDGDVAGGDEAGAAAEASALDQRDGGDGEPLESAGGVRGQPGDAEVLGGGGGGHFVAPAQVHTGLEVPAVASEDDDPNAGASAEVVHRRVERGDQVAIVGIVDLGPVEGHRRGPAPVDLPQDGRVGHQRRASDPTIIIVVMRATMATFRPAVKRRRRTL